MHFPFTRYEIEGTSMKPTFQPGDRVLIFRWGTIQPGDVVVFCKNGMKMIKRAVKKAGDRWILRGDNFSASTDSLDFGTISPDSIIGKVVSTY